MKENMAEIQNLTKENLRIYKGKKVIFYGHNFSNNLYLIFKYMGIEMLGFCTSNTNLENYFKVAFKNIRLIKPSQLIEFTKDGNIIIQGISFDSIQITEMKMQVESLGLEFSEISSGRILNSFEKLICFDMYSNSLKYNYLKIYKKIVCNVKHSYLWFNYKTRGDKNTIIICSPPKTADYSIVHTFDQINKDKKEISYLNLWHNPKLINRKGYEKQLKKCRIIMGIREPISQNLSDLYQHISNGSYLSSLVFDETQYMNPKDKNSVLNDYKKLFEEDNQSVQTIWNRYTDIYMHDFKTGKRKRGYYGFIQSFFEVFKESVIDITAYPFDKEAGYVIIKEGNMEVFIYQLEKLNNIVPQLSEWVGVPFESLVRANDASDKWIGESYKCAQLEIEISRDYFEKCYNENYVNHCYSEADIIKFKEKWSSHIR